MHEIRRLFEQKVTLSDPEWQRFAQALQRTELPRKTLLIQKGKVENYLSFIEEGMTRSFIPGPVDEELTFAFNFKNSFVSAYQSFISRQPALFMIETLADTLLWRIHYNDLQAIYNSTTTGDRIGRLAAEELFMAKSSREFSLLSDSAEERYLKLFSEQPLLLQSIPLKYIASYIGITPQALSRIRKRIS